MNLLILVADLCCCYSWCLTCPATCDEHNTFLQVASVCRQCECKRCTISKWVEIKWVWLLLCCSIHNSFDLVSKDITFFPLIYEKYITIQKLNNTVPKFGVNKSFYYFLRILFIHLFSIHLFIYNHLSFNNFLVFNLII